MIASKLKGKVGAAGQDTTGDDHPINMARKAIDLNSTIIFRHENGQRTYLTPELAEFIIYEYVSLMKPGPKERFINQIWASRKGLDDYIDALLS